MKIAINTSCAVAGGAVTHLRYLLPELVPMMRDDELILIGDTKMREKVDPHGLAPWEEVAPISSGLCSRLAFENLEQAKVGIRPHDFLKAGQRRSHRLFSA